MNPYTITEWMWGHSLMSLYTCSDPRTSESIVVNFVVLYKSHAIFVLRKVRKNVTINKKKTFIKLNVVCLVVEENCRRYSYIIGTGRHRSREGLGRDGRGREWTGCYPYKANQTSKANKLYLPRRFRRAVRYVFYCNERWGYFSF